MYHELKNVDKAAARNHLIKAFSFSNEQINEIARQIIAKMPAKNFQLILSPCEADAQCAFLHKCGLCDVIITNDSDLLLYNPSMVLFNYDPKSLGGKLVQRDDIFQNMFTGCDTVMMRKCAILSGCDYTKSLYGVALKSAKKVLEENNFNVDEAINELVDMGKQIEYDSLETYKKNVEAAACCFALHVIFNPFTQKLEYYKNVPKETVSWAKSILGFDFFGDLTKDPSACWAGQSTIQQRYDELKMFYKSDQYSNTFRKLNQEELGWITPVPTTK